MTVLEIISGILVVLTAASYVPQWHRLYTLQTSSGISLLAACLTTLVSQGQVASIVFHWLYPQDNLIWHHNEYVSAQHTVDLIQILVQWMCTLVTFVLVCIHYPVLDEETIELEAIESNEIHESGQDQDRSVLLASSVLLLHGFSCLVGLFCASRPREYWFSGQEVIMIDQTAFVRIWTCLIIVATIAQTAQTRKTTNGNNSLSNMSLLLQGVNYTLLAALWPQRFFVPEHIGSGYQGLLWILEIWHPWVGWIFVNNVVLAIGIVVVLAIILGREERRISL